MAIRKGFMLVVYDEDDICQGFVERHDIQFFANGWDRVVGPLDTIRDLRKTMQVKQPEYKYKVFEIKEVP